MAELLSLPPISILTPLQLVEESSTRPSSCVQVDHEEKLICRITELTAARLAPYARKFGLRGETEIKISSVTHSQCHKVVSPSNERVIRGTLLALFVQREGFAKPCKNARKFGGIRIAKCSPLNTGLSTSGRSGKSVFPFFILPWFFSLSSVTPRQKLWIDFDGRSFTTR